MNRIPPGRKLKQEFDNLLQGYDGEQHPLDAFVRLGDGICFR